MYSMYVGFIPALRQAYLLVSAQERKAFFSWSRSKTCRWPKVSVSVGIRMVRGFQCEIPGKLLFHKRLLVWTSESLLANAPLIGPRRTILAELR